MDPFDDEWQPRLPDVVVYRGPTGWPAVVDAYLDGYSGNTAAAYRRDLADWTAWCEARPLNPLDATRADLQRYTAEQLEQHKPPTVKRRLSPIAGVYKWCVVEGLLDRSPAEHVRRPKVSEESNTRGLDASEMRAMLTAARGRTSLEYALVALLTQNGLRISAACNADVEDLGVENGIRFLAIILKGNKPDRRRLSDLTAAAIDAHLAGRRRGPLLVDEDGGRLDRYKGRRIVMHLAELAGIPPGVTAHSCRHGFATTALEAGAKLEDVQDAMGHADPRTTQRYNRKRRQLERDPTQLLGRLFDEPGDRGTATSGVESQRAMSHPEPPAQNGPSVRPTGDGQD